jgi:hypothetical protein
MRRARSHDVERYAAASNEAVYQSWHDYVAYLEAHLALIALQLAGDEEADGFEETGSRRAQEQQIQARLSQLPTAQRALFDRVRTLRRHEAQASAEAEATRTGRRTDADPLQIDRQALVQLLESANGVGSASGEGVVPIGERDDGAISWWSVNVEQLRDAPTADAYRLQTREGNEQRRAFMRAGGVLLVAALCLLAYFLWPSSATTEIVVGDMPAQVGSERVNPWPLTRLELSTLSGTVSLPVSSTLRAEWPAGIEGDVAIWQRPALLPLRLCAPGQHLGEASEAILQSVPGEAQRLYTLQTEPPAQPDLLLVACDDGTVQRFGVLLETRISAEQTLGSGVATAATTITVTSILAAGSATHPDLPAGEHAVVVELEAASPIVWPSWSPVLLLPDGEQRIASGSDTSGTTATLRYLVPAISAPQPAIFQLTPPGSQQALRWRALLAPPPSRTVFLRDALAIDTPPVTLIDEDTIQIVATLRNQGNTPVQLRADDIRFERDGRDQSSLLQHDWDLTRPLAPGDTRDLTISLQRPASGDTTTLQVGPHRFTLQP